MPYGCQRVHVRLAVVAELQDIRDFLRGQPLFSVLPEAALDLLTRRIVIRYLRRGASFPPDDVEASSFYVLRKGAVELRDAGGALREKLAEGDSLDGAGLADTEGRSLAGVAVEDTLFYVLGAADLEAARRECPEFDAGFEQSVAERLRRAREAAPDVSRAGGNLLRLQVSDLVTRPPVCGPPEMTVREAAALMTRERVSSLLVVSDGGLQGVVTDRDLRSRCVAAGLDGAAPLREVMTPRPHTVGPAASAFEALLTMSRLRIHHLPVVEGERVRGMISTHDLLRAQSSNPLYLADLVGRCATVEDLRETVRGSRELHVQLVAANASARQLGQATTLVCDAVTRRLIEFALARLGAPPVPFAWVATGSQGRGELTLHSDQDNALLLDDSFDSAGHGEYFAALASDVNQGLDACGYVRCPGDVMASNPRWRQPVAEWRRYFLDWITHTVHKSATLAANFLDMRTVWGSDGPRQQLMSDVRRRAAGEGIFIAYLAGHALGNQPPIGFFRNFVLVRSGDHEGKLNLKTHGLLPIVDLARVYAVAAGAESVATLARLQEAAGRGRLTEEGSDNLQAAFEFIWMLRARHQADQLRRNLEADNFVAPDELNSLERKHLKDAFAAIATMQRALSTAHGDRLPA